ncbi:MAG: rhodanese-like domain-containing protein [Lachnospiraceae bacterium]|nr:rhodanese-like domain-containing protein [Lachnospiraceae bacterium]
MMEVITVEEALRLGKQEKVLILDLRPPGSYRQFHIDNAVLYSLDKIENREFCLPKEYCIILYCERGGLSLMAARILDKEGFCAKTVIGGMQAYREYMRRMD